MVREGESQYSYMVKRYNRIYDKKVNDLVPNQLTNIYMNMNKSPKYM